MSRPLPAALLLALALVWIAPIAGASEPVEQSVAVLPPRASEMLSSVDRGIQEWLVTRSAAAGLSPLQRGVVAAAVERVRGELERSGASGDEVLLGTHAAALARESGAALLLFSDLRYDSGQIDVRLRLHEGEGGAVVAGSRVEGKLGELGSLLQEAMDSVITVAGLSPGKPGAAEPRLSELGRYERAVRRIEAGELATGWRELSGMESATAVSLRNEIRAIGNLDSTPISERSRLASASGTQDKSWLHVRRAMVEGDDPEMMLAGADAAMAREDPQLAKKLYGEALAIDPDHRDAHIGMARAAAEAGEIEAARPALERAIALDPSDPEPYEMLGSLSGVEPEERAGHLLAAGEIRSQRLEIEPAERNYQQAGDLEPSVVGRAQQNVAAFNERMGRYENALLSYEDAVAVGEPDPDLMAGLGRSRERMGDLEGAEEAYSAALAMDDTHAASLHGMGSVMNQTGRPGEAIPLLEKAVASRDEMGKARQDLATAYHSAGDPDAALATLTTGDVQGPERADLLRQAAEIQQEEGRLDEARITLEEAKSIEPFDPPIHAALVEVYEAQGDPDAAKRERMRLASLQGRAIAPTSHADGPLSRKAGPAVGTPKDFERLFASFPVENPESRKEIRKVAYLGLRSQQDGEALARRLLSPFAVDLAALDEAILNGIFTRYEAQPPPDPWPEVAVGATERLIEFGTAREDIALVNDELGVDAAFVVELERQSDPTGSLVDERYVLRVRMVAGKRPEKVVIRANELTFPAAPPFRIWNLLALVPLALVLALLSYPFVRGWGTVVVELDWDQGPDTKGFFSIEISKRPGRVKPQREQAGKSKAYRYQKKTSPFKRGAANMVGRETTFRFIPAGQRYVTVHGLLLDELSRDVIGNYLEERRVKIPRGRPERVSFDFTRRDASLEVRVVLPEGAETTEMPQLPVALRGRPDTLRYMRDGSTLFRVGDGQHGVLVAESDRVHDVDVLVSDHRSALVTITLGSDDTAAFTGCPAAVEPYVQGNVAEASRALDRAGQTEIANLLRARFHEERGEAEEAARYYQAAGHTTQAAEVAADVVDPELSASRFEEAGDFGRAAEKYQEAGDVLKAAEALEASYDYEGAIEAYRKAGADGKVIELLEKTGGYYEAGQLAAAGGDEERAIQLLQLVDLRDPDYSQACMILARIFMGREEWDLAVHKAEEAIQATGEGASLQLHEQLARALDRSGRTQEAITTWETIRKRDAQYPEAAQQLEYLRQRLADAGTRADPEAATHIGGASDATDAMPGAGGGAVPAAAEERYEILGELGRGGMGIVFKAKDTRLGRVVALKRLPDNLRDHPTAVQLFLREARAAAALNHPNIVTLFDADQSSDGNYYLTMEMLEGLPLDQILERRTRLGARDTLRLATQISTGLQFAHEKGVIHRDIKTSNLFFTQDKVVKIMDFGLAKMTEEVRRAATVIGGTPYYMAPEQSEGKGVDHRADLYAFGVTLFELLTGSVPFKEGDVAYHHRHTPPPDPRELVPDLPAPVAELVLRLMEKKPEDRFAATAELSARLAELIRAV